MHLKLIGQNVGLIHHPTTDIDTRIDACREIGIVPIGDVHALAKQIAYGLEQVIPLECEP